MNRTNLRGIIKKALSDWLESGGSSTKKPKPVSKPTAPTSTRPAQVETAPQTTPADVRNRKKSGEEIRFEGGVRTTPFASFNDKKTGHTISYSHLRHGGKGVSVRSGKPVLEARMTSAQKEFLGHPQEVEHKFQEVHKKMGYTPEDHMHAAAMWNVAGLKSYATDTRIASTHQLPTKGSSKRSVNPKTKAALLDARANAKELLTHLTARTPPANAVPRKLSTTVANPHKPGGKTLSSEERMAADMGPKFAETAAGKPTTAGLSPARQLGNKEYFFADKQDFGAMRAHSALWHMEQHLEAVKQHYASRGELEVKPKKRDRKTKKKGKIAKADYKVTVIKPQRAPTKPQYMRVRAGAHTTHPGDTSEVRQIRQQGKKTISPRQASGTDKTYHPHVVAMENMVNTFKERMKAGRSHEKELPSARSSHMWGSDHSVRPLRHDVDHPLHETNMGRVHGTAQSGHTITTEVMSGQWKPPAQRASEREARRNEFEESHFHIHPSVDVGDVGAADITGRATGQHLSTKQLEAKESQAEGKHGSKMVLHGELASRGLFGPTGDDDSTNEWEHYMKEHGEWSVSARLKAKAIALLRKAFGEEIWTESLGDVANHPEGHKYREGKNVSYKFKSSGKTASGKDIHEISGISIRDAGGDVSAGPAKPFHVTHSGLQSHKALHGGYSAEDHADAMIHHVKQMARYAKMAHHKGTLSRDQWQHHKSHMMSHYNELQNNPRYADTGINSLKGVNIDKPVLDIADWETKNAGYFHPKGANSIKVSPKARVKQSTGSASAKLKRAMTAGYGYAGAPGALRGGSVLMTEDLEKKPRYVIYKTCPTCKSIAPHLDDTICLKCLFDKGWSEEIDKEVKKSLAKLALQSYLKKSTAAGYTTVDAVQIFEQKLLGELLKSKHGAIQIGQTGTGKAIKMAYKQADGSGELPGDLPQFYFGKHHADYTPDEHLEAVGVHLTHADKQHVIGSAVSNLVRDLHMFHAMKHLLAAGECENASKHHNKFARHFGKYYSK